MRGAAGVTRLRHRVLAAIRRDALWNPGDAVAVAVSGGRDSVALLDLLVLTAAAHGGRLSVVTVDHGVRAESSADAAFVAELSARYDLGCAVHAITPAGDDEQSLRRARLAVFAALPVARVAVGHHRDDAAETALLQLIRGTGVSGMRARSGRVVRPALDLTRDELAAWAAHRGLSWREDASNADPRYLRNRLRAEVLPLLEAIRPGATRAMARGGKPRGVGQGE